jgi:hypothetical protein
MNGRRVVPLLAALQVVTLATGQAQGDQQALAQRILTGNVAEQDGAVWTAMTLGSQAGPELRAALITLLKRNNRVRDEAAKRKVAVATLVDPEFVAHVAHAVSQLEYPDAIPALAGALGSGSTLVPHALADFGEPAASAVLRVVTDPEAHYEAVSNGLLSLRFMVEGREARPLSAATLDDIRRAANQRLTARQRAPTVWKAIDLAVVLDDPDLRRIVESIAADTSEIVARGITDQGSIELTQRLAAGRLANLGRPFNPRYRTPAERAQALGLPARRNDGPAVIKGPQ